MFEFNLITYPTPKPKQMNITNCTNHTILAHNTLECLSNMNRPELGFNESMLAVTPPTLEYLKFVCSELTAKQFPSEVTTNEPGIAFNHLGPITHCIRHCLAMIAYQPRILDAYDAVRYINIPHEDRIKHIGLSATRLAKFGDMVRQFDTSVQKITPNIARAIASAVLEEEFVNVYLTLLNYAAPDDSKSPIPIINPHTYHDQRDKFGGVAA
jgi:hypothetical protein